MDITIRNLQTKIPIRLSRVQKVALHTLQSLRVSDAQLSIVFVAVQRMRRLNAAHLHHCYVTDILTFDYRLPGDDRLLAEIVICPSIAVQNAIDYGTTTAKEIDLYVVHGLLHLTGFDDHTPEDIQAMREKEKEIMGSLK
jgi:probable rRNA maturation factor